MSFDFHINALSKLCRVCGNRLTKSASVHEEQALLKCCDYRKQIYSVFGVSTWEDTADDHPIKLCGNCARKIRHDLAGTRTYNQSNNQTLPQWTRHTRIETCNVCADFAKLSKGGRPRKRNWRRSQNSEKLHLPFLLSDENIFSKVSTGDNILGETCPTLDIFGKQGEEFLYICAFCQCIISPASVQTPCQHYFCAKCLSDFFKYMKSENVNCPTCMSIVNYNEIADSPRILKVQLENLTVVCIMCTKLGKLESFYNHSCSPTQEPRKYQHVTIVETTLPPKKDHEILQAANLLRDEALKHKRGDPIPYAIEQATDRWTWMKLQQGDKVVSLKTGGRVSQTL